MKDFSPDIQKLVDRAERTKRHTPSRGQRRHLTKAEAKRQFHALVPPAFRNQDRPAYRMAMVEFIDGLQRDGQITMHQAETWDFDD